MSIGIRTPGPIHHFVSFRAGSGPTAGFYLGTAVAAPESEEEKFKIPIMNDIGGRSVPFQLVQDGEVWVIYTTLNRFDYDLLQSIRALEAGITPVPLPPGGAASILGRETPTARGTLVIGITDFQLITVNGYAGTPAAGSFIGGASDLPVARTFSSCNLRKYKESTIGSRVLEVALAIECQNVYNPNTMAFSCFVEGPPQVPLTPIT